MKLAEWSLSGYRLRYEREIRWAHGAEDEGLFAMLRLVSSDGAVGVAEGVIKPAWTGVSLRSLTAGIEDVLLPRLRAVDLGDATAVSEALEAVPENRLAKGMIQTACCTMRAAGAGTPLWRLWGGEPRVPLSFTVTRQAPDRMAREAGDMVGRFGFRTLKVKGGQGLATDLQALAAIRAAAGPDVRLYVDANAAYAREAAAEYVGRIADAGAAVAEDPCELLPDSAFEALQRAAPIPILVDSSCVTRQDAVLFLARGAAALSAKPARIGLTEAREIARLAEAAGGTTVVGLHAESALGTLLSLQLAAATPARARAADAEQTFYLVMRDQVLAEPLTIRDGAVTLPETADVAGLVDWDRLRRYAV